MTWLYVFGAALTLWAIAFALRPRNVTCFCDCGATASFFSPRRAERWLDFHAQLHGGGAA